MHILRRFTIPALASFVLLLTITLPGGPARADAIDGHWCHAEGGLMSIAGPSIVTPRGRETSGDYRRHFFTYHVPASEPAAGSVVFMTQLDEQTVQVRRGADLAAAEAAAPEIWRRCSAKVS